MKYRIEEIKYDNIEGKEYITCFYHKKHNIAYKVITDGKTCTARIQSDNPKLKMLNSCSNEFPKYVLNNLEL